MRTDKTRRLLWESAEGPELQPPRRPVRRTGVHQPLGGAASLSLRPWQLALAAGIALSFGAVVAVITDDWWLLPLAAAINALGTGVAAFAVTRIATNTSPRWDSVRYASPPRTPTPSSVGARLEPISKSLGPRLRLAGDTVRELARASLSALAALLATHEPQRSHSQTWRSYTEPRPRPDRHSPRRARPGQPRTPATSGGR